MAYAGLSFEAGCRRNQTSTLYSAAGYFLCIKDKKCVIYSQSRYRDNDHSFFHYQSLIIVTTIDLSIVNNASQTGKRVAVFHWSAKVWYLCMAMNKFYRPTKNQSTLILFNQAPQNVETKIKFPRSEFHHQMANKRKERYF